VIAAAAIGLVVAFAALAAFALVAFLEDGGRR
jgi:hypothetical protein